MDMIAPPQEVATERFFQDVAAGLSAASKSLPCKYFYDQRGSQLFDQICELDAYYVTRTEMQIMQSFAAEMAAELSQTETLVELGSGSSVKTRLLLDQMDRLAVYAPVDISGEHLYQTAIALKRAYPHLDIAPQSADFTQPISLPEHLPQDGVAAYFPGSTIGNFEPDEAVKLMQAIATTCGPGGELLIGVDLAKPEEVLLNAYDDPQQITAAFNLNLLRRINQELEGNFDLSQFRHMAIFNAEASRMELYLESLVEQTVSVGEHEFQFSAGERILTEYSHKYSIAQFTDLAAAAGFTIEASWTDDREYFAVMLLRVLGR
ncbi:L-histidine N(alpha)-methyltransferase [Blastopirellula sp. J2-11]|uniref:L-histidine N(alpha)-methyltransferase n=1 Tax=Blastopirellula sp. J2-11 TaxID=2943192 RepID=UPI0021C76416|nr:L-histidine N(alpha)-methyltransferase [Blastopirellula sp. J2-11]UUO04752.1 L-histidine N(alpha)-methyltransferase [Blastopirellula sp. J2-11]